ncbi:MAG: hypothetical protein ACREQ5_08710, partial [Candidatus Dormibacteria bacterium]
MDEMTPEEALAILKTFPAGRKKLRELEIVSGFAIEQFTPRPDDPADFEEQTSFIKADDRLSILLGGTGSGKTLAAAVKTARRVLNEPPPREYCPFWVVGESYQLTCSVCWGEKLRHLIPPHRISFHAWHDRRRNWPAAVGITDCRDPTRTGWVLEFKSYG